MYSVVFGVLFAFSSPATAQQLLTWKEAIDIAKKNNAELRAGLETLQSSRYQENVARGGFLPQLSADFDYVRSETDLPTPTATAQTTTQEDTRYSASISGTQNLFSGLDDFGRIRQAKANTKVALASLHGTKARVSFDLKSAYEHFYYAKEYQRLTSEIIHRREENLKLVELRFESGRENKGSVLLSRAYLNQAIYDDLQAKNAEDIARRQLQRALGVDLSGPIGIQDQVPVADPPSPPPDFEALSTTTPDYEQALAQEEESKAGVLSARSPFFPTLDLRGSVGKEDSGFFPDRDFWSIGLNFSIPFFNGGRDYYSTQSALSSWQSLLNSRLDARREAIVSLRQTYATYVEAVEKLKVDDSFKQAAVVRAEIARNRYNNGLLSFEDWDIIENDLILRQRAYLQSRRDRVVAEAAWERSQGKGIFPNG